MTSHEHLLAVNIFNKCIAISPKRSAFLMSSNTLIIKNPYAAKPKADSLQTPYRRDVCNIRKARSPNISGSTTKKGRSQYMNNTLCCNFLFIINFVHYYQISIRFPSYQLFCLYKLNDDH
mmetsp:Transcript_29053/g.42837  ORF Transcript_29053/g.42837 Transcript_29053/m.42837 type:complete len:120 (-) Transcript_29053:552-911(-)